jgi:hypothetical protein
LVRSETFALTLVVGASTTQELKERYKKRDGKSNLKTVKG